MHLASRQCMQLAEKLGALHRTMGEDKGAVDTASGHALCDEGMLDHSPGALYPTNRARYVGDGAGSAPEEPSALEQAAAGSQADGDGEKAERGSGGGGGRGDKGKSGAKGTALAHASCGAQDYQRLFDAQTPLTCSSLTRAIQTAVLSVREIHLRPCRRLGAWRPRACAE